MSPTTSLAQPIAALAAADPDAPAVIVGMTVTTFAELDHRIRASVPALDELVGAGTKVAVIGPNHPGWIELYYAVPGSGRLLVFLNHRLGASELATLLGRSGSSAVIGDPGQLSRLREAGVDLPLVDWDRWAEIVDTVVDPAPLPDVDPDQPAWLLFTSGTTAAPKGALLSHRNVLAAVEASAAARPVEPDDIYVFPFPLCHVAGYNVVHRHVHGRPVVLISQFDAAMFCETVAATRATSTSLAATMLATLVDAADDDPRLLEKLSSLRSIAYGAAPMSTSLLMRANALLGVDFAQGYGMTELSGNAVFLDAAAHRRGLDGEPELLRAAGIPAPGVELRIVDDDDVEVEPGDQGEICVRAPQVMLGYLDDLDATDSALAGGWMHTGDIGRMIDGMLHVVDRKKDIIITGGENVSSLEVEEAVLRHPDILRVAVVGVPDEKWGENVCAVVVVRDPAVFDPQGLIASVRSSLGGFKVPRHVVIVDDLPVNGAGKLQKNELREWLEKNSSLLSRRN